MFASDFHQLATSNRTMISDLSKYNSRESTIKYEISIINVDPGIHRQSCKDNYNKFIQTILHSENKHSYKITLISKYKDVSESNQNSIA